MTKAEIKTVIKRTSYINDMIKKGIDELQVYIGGKKEKIVVDENINTLLDIMDCVIVNEDDEERKIVYEGMRKGISDKTVLANNKISRTRYYLIKGEFLCKVLIYAVEKGLTTREEILKGPIW